MNQPVLSEYLDYRAYLKDMFSFMKKSNPHFSYRYFSRVAGFASPNFLQLVMSGKRNLTPESAAKICKGFNLKKSEREYFENLVWLNQSNNHEDKNHYYKKIVNLKGNPQVRKLDKAAYEYFSQWYYPAVRELIVLGNRKWTPERITEAISPKITIKEAEKAIKALFELNLISVNEEGEYRQNEAFLTTGPEVQSLAVANFHKSMMKLGTESIDAHSHEKRDITSLTVSIKSDRIVELKALLAKTRRDILKEYCSDNECDTVYQLNMQLFPLSGTVIKEEIL
jgi:uncharacterized protein (TIGR02147 family)